MLRRVIVIQFFLINFSHPCNVSLSIIARFAGVFAHHLAKRFVDKTVRLACRSSYTSWNAP